MEYGIEIVYRGFDRFPDGEAGEIFFALRGETFDGHEFIGRAFLKAQRAPLSMIRR